MTPPMRTDVTPVQMAEPEGNERPCARILLVDDKPQNLRALESTLADLGEPLDCAQSGDEALRWLMRNDYAVILLDVQMPGMDGFETARFIRARPRSHFTPILFVTATSAQEADVRQGYALGAVDWVTKPVDPEILRSKVAVFVALFKKTEHIKRAKENFRKVNEDLEQRTAQLAAANRELEAFAHSVSHDLRASLRHIDGFSQLLVRHLRDRMDETSQGYSAMITESVAQMGQLLDGLQALSRIGRPELQIGSVDLGTLVHEVCDEVASECGSRTIDWQFGALPRVEADPLLLRVVLRNLISNAAKYTAPRPEAHVEIGALACDEGDPVTIFVRDNGVGFDMQQAGKLFGAFQRLHRREDFEGTGIGLATVQRIVQRHGGRVWAEAEPDRGATFFFTLKAVQGKGHEERQHEAA